MQYLILKYLITAGTVVLISEFAKHSDKLGGLLAALPVVTILTLIWLYHRATAASQNSQSRLLYLLVCTAYLADVFVVSILAAKIWFLGDFNHLRSIYYRSVCNLCSCAQALWY